MSSSGSRNFICTVVFIDIAGFSKKPVTEQLRLKEQLNHLLAVTLADVPVKDRIILDTGDGAAISFLGDPEDGLFLSLALRDTLASGDSPLQLRTGINLGPVRLVKDINNQPNIIGDGINVAQRVMDFAAVNQVLASRSYYEVIAALSADHARLFRFEGTRTDKHVREHEVYALGNAAAPHRAPRQKTAPAAAIEKLGSTASVARSGIMRRPLLATTLAVALIIGIAIALRLTLRTPAAELTQATQTELPGAATEPAIPTGTPQPPPDQVKPEARSKSARPPAADVTASPRERGSSATTGVVRLTVLPWGEVYVDAQRFGVAPPLRDIALKPGMHRIELRNPGFASYVQLVEIRAGEEIKIVHRFR